MNGRRGFTLLEVLIALGILAVGGLGTLQLLDVLSRSNGNVSAESEALGLARQLRAEMELEQLLAADLGDAVWVPGLHVAGGGEIVSVGDVTLPNGGRYRVEYTVGTWNPDIDGDGINDGVRGLDITIVVDNVDLVRTSATETRARLLRPVVLGLRKEVQSSVAVITGGVLRW